MHTSRLHAFTSAHNTLSFSPKHSAHSQTSLRAGTTSLCTHHTLDNTHTPLHACSFASHTTHTLMTHALFTRTMYAHTQQHTHTRISGFIHTKTPRQKQKTWPEKWLEVDHIPSWIFGSESGWPAPGLRPRRFNSVADLF